MDESETSSGLSELNQSPSDTPKAQTNEKGRAQSKAKAENTKASQVNTQTNGQKRKRNNNENTEETERKSKKTASANAREGEDGANNKTRVKQEVSPTADDTQEKSTISASPKTTKKARKVKKENIQQAGESQTQSESQSQTQSQGKVQKTPRKRATKEEKEAAAMPLAARSVGLKHFIGAHVSSAGGVHNSVTNAQHIGGNAFALFLKSQRKWANPPITADHISQFRQNCKSLSYASEQHIVPHGSYLVNLAHIDPARAKQAYDGFIDDLSRCNQLGIGLYNFHPGNCATSSREEALAHLAKQLNNAHKDPASGTVITLLETMAGTGNTIGGTFEDLKEVIDMVDEKDRVGICLDTCHIFAAGYDLRSPEAFKETFDKFDKIIGLDYLKALHVNDSKAPLKSCRDLHANLGTGFLGLRAFHNLMNFPRLHNTPLILETPIDIKNDEGKDVEDKSVWVREIKLLENLVGMDVNSKKFKDLETKLAADGAEERARVGDQVKRREEKAKSRSGRKSKKNQRQQETTSEESE